MALTLPPKSGLASPVFTNIPQAWSKEWFRRVISSQLSNSDIRNAIAGPGISITGKMNTVATVSVVNTAQSLTANGYVVEPSGLIRQWGLVTPATHGSNTVIFPSPFPGACFNVTATLAAVAATTATIYVGTPSKTQVVFTIQDGSSTTDSFYWSAIGN